MLGAESWLRWPSDLLGPKYRYIMPDHLNYFELRTLRRPFNSISGLGANRLRNFALQSGRDLEGLEAEAHRRVPDEERARLLRRNHSAMKQSPWLWPLRPVYDVAEEALSLGGLGG